MVEQETAKIGVKTYQKKKKKKKGGGNLIRLTSNILKAGHRVYGSSKRGSIDMNMLHHMPTCVRGGSTVTSNL